MTICMRDHGPVPMSDETRKALSRAAKQFDRWRGEREDLILQAHSEGASLREIAGEVGLTHVAVMKIVNRGTRIEETIDRMREQT